MLTDCKHDGRHDWSCFSTVFKFEQTNTTRDTILTHLMNMDYEDLLDLTWTFHVDKYCRTHHVRKDKEKRCHVVRNIMSEMFEILAPHLIFNYVKHNPIVDLGLMKTLSFRHVVHEIYNNNSVGVCSFFDENSLVNTKEFNDVELSNIFCDLMCNTLGCGGIYSKTNDDYLKFLFFKINTQKTNDDVAI